MNSDQLKAIFTLLQAVEAIQEGDLTNVFLTLTGITLQTGDETLIEIRYDDDNGLYLVV